MGGPYVKGLGFIVAVILLESLCYGSSHLGGSHCLILGSVFCAHPLLRRRRASERCECGVTLACKCNHNVCVCTYIYMVCIYVYIQREREAERERETKTTETEAERKRDTEMQRCRDAETETAPVGLVCSLSFRWLELLGGRFSCFYSGMSWLRVVRST